MRLIDETSRVVNILGIDDHTMDDIKIGTAAGVTRTQHGEAILIFHQGAYTGKGHSVISPAQLEAFDINVDDRSRKSGGTQSIITPEGYGIPITITQGLAYIPLRPFKDEEWDALPHIIMTSDEDWNPSINDFDPLTQDADWEDTLQKLSPASPHDELFDLKGDYRLIDDTRPQRYGTGNTLQAQNHTIVPADSSDDTPPTLLDRDYSDFGPDEEVLNDTILYHDCPDPDLVPHDKIDDDDLPYLRRQRKQHRGSKACGP